MKRHYNSMMHHYLLTRFNLALWQEDKNGQTIDRGEWLRKRLKLFETYCLPSVAGQTCQEFRWILLVDADTPADLRERIKAYRNVCTQMKFVAVRAEYACRFADIFRQVVAADVKQKGWNEGDLCLTTYLDNDDCIARTFVEQVQKECVGFGLSRDLKRFLSFDYGLQTFTQLRHFSTRIHYPNNHFLTLAECLSAAESSLSAIRTCYGFGSHFLLERRGLARVAHINNRELPMWIEIIHEENVDNDVKMTFDTHVVKDKDLLKRDFSLNVDIDTNHRLAFCFRALKQVWRRTKNKFKNK